MNKQFIISIGREFGSGGHVIGEKLAEYYQIPLYDQNILLQIAADRQGVDPEVLRSYDEKARNPLTTRTFHGISSSMADGVARLQFDFLKEKAAAGESFIVIGRCSEHILAEYPCLISCFVRADEEFRIRRTMELFQLIREEAVQRNDATDAKRRRYHNSYYPNSWGVASNYDMVLDSSAFKINGCVEILKAAVAVKTS